MTENLKERYERLLEAKPKTRIRNAAHELGVSEVELLALRTGEGVVRLRPDFRALMAGIPRLGRVMALSRNDDAVHERKGAYQHHALEDGHAGYFSGDDIDLRIFWGPWDSAFAVEEPGADGARRSIQFFASDGEAMHKVYMLPESNLEAYNALVEEFRAEDQGKEQNVRPWPAEPAEKPDADIDAEGFRQAWLSLQDTHDFYAMFRRYKVTRRQALRLAPAGHATRVDNKAMRELVTRAVQQGTSIMVFIGNKGMIQIHTGPVKNLMDVPGWFNVVDPHFNMHVREEAITESWIVRKPTAHGPITALECFDKNGVLVVQFYGERTRHEPEHEDWRELIGSIESDLAPTPAS